MGGMATDDEKQLFMRLPNLRGLEGGRRPPEGYALRAAGPADYPGVASVIGTAFEEPWDAARVARALGPAEGVEAIFVVVRGPQVVATASARVLPEAYPGSGYVHYVGVHPDDRGRALGELVTLAVLGHFAGRGLADAVLETDAFRVAALRTYLRMGFVPDYRQPHDPERWSQVMRTLFARGGGPARG